MSNMHLEEPDEAADRPSELVEVSKAQSFDNQPPGSRLHDWHSRSWRVPLVTYIDETDDSATAAKRIEDALLAYEEETSIDIIMAAKELVFDVEPDGSTVLTALAWILDMRSREQVLGPIFQFQDFGVENTKSRLMAAILFDVPVVPNTPQVAGRLEALFADLMDNGYIVQDDENNRRALVPSDNLKFSATSMPMIRRIVQPAEIAYLLTALDEQRKENARAKQLIKALQSAIGNLRELLQRADRNEHDLQRCLTRHPILFGPSYRRVIPKHPLGSEYELDYALELADGSIDVVEIEASTHALYRRTGDPTAALIHAEQQVLDWLAWLDEHSTYARFKLPGVRRACGIVVIGRRDKMSSRDLEKLHWRNMMYGGRLTVLTFDDLLDRSESLLNLLDQAITSGAESS